MSGRGRYPRDEFDYSATSSSAPEPPKKYKTPHAYSAILDILEADGIFRPAIIAAVVIFGLVACTALGLSIWNLVSGNSTKSAGAAAIASIESAGENLASQVQSLASSISTITSQEANSPPPLNMQQVMDAICATGSGVIGFSNSSQFSQDDCDSIYIVTSRFKIPTSLWAAKTFEACAMFGPTLDGLNQFRMAMYADDGYGVPDALLGVSAIGTVDGNAISCVSANFTLGEPEYYWLAVMSNANDCGSINSLYYATNPGLRSAFTDAYTWPDFPATINTPSLTYFSAVYAMYVSYNATCISKLSGSN